MIKELKYIFYLLVIFFFIFFTGKYYFSDENKKKSYRSLKLIDNKIKAELFVMQSNGGVYSAEAAVKSPVHMVESGPAAGAERPRDGQYPRRREVQPAADAERLAGCGAVGCGGGGHAQRPLWRAGLRDAGR